MYEEWLILFRAYNNDEVEKLCCKYILLALVCYNILCMLS